MPISIERLCYVVLASRDLECAATFAATEFGLEPCLLSAGEQGFRSDERQYSLVYSTIAPGGGAVGLELRDVHTLRTAVDTLQTHRIHARYDAALAVRRNVRHLAAFTTPGGLHLELVVRPQHQGRWFFPSRDSGIVGLAAVSLRSTDIHADETLLTSVFNAFVRDWIGDAAYLGLDAMHHRLAVSPADSAGVLAVEFAVNGLDQVMQQYYRLRATPQAIVHGPGRCPVSQQLFVTFAGPDTLYSVVAEGERIDPAGSRRPLQFAMTSESHCGWGSACGIAEMNPVAVLPRSRFLRGVSRA